MDESALERYFDQLVANEEQEEEEQEEVNCDLSSLPDELLTLFQDDSDKESSTSLDYSSQNPTAAAELPGGSSVAARPMTPVTPETPEAPEAQQPEILPKILNVISTLNLGCSLDLHLIAHKTWNVEYKPEVFKALIMRIRKPPTTALIFRSGKIVCSGAKSEEKSRLASRKYSRIVQKLGFPVRFLNFKIRNIVANGKAFPVRLEQLAHHHLCSYEPELFPGLFFHSLPGVSATIFSSGKIFLSGAKTEEEVQQVFHHICGNLKVFRRP